MQLVLLGLNWGSWIHIIMWWARQLNMFTDAGWGNYLNYVPMQEILNGVCSPCFEFTVTLRSSSCNCSWDKRSEKNVRILNFTLNECKTTFLKWWDFFHRCACSACIGICCSITRTILHLVWKSKQISICRYVNFTNESFEYQLSQMLQTR